MEYRIEFSDEAEAELDAAYLFLSNQDPDQAIRWYKDIHSAISTLSQFPRRCPLAFENEQYPTNEVRQLLYGKGRNIYRILFTVFEEEQEVRVLHVYHGARQTRLTAPEDE